VLASGASARPEPADRFTRMPRVESKRTEPLSAVLHREGTKTIYTFDFGDNWEHDILLEKWLLAEPDITYPFARRADSPAHWKTAAASPATTICSMPSPIPAIHVTKNSATGSATSSTLKRFHRQSQSSPLSRTSPQQKLRPLTPTSTAQPCPNDTVFQLRNSAENTR
jgi:hypothetical protein